MRRTGKSSTAKDDRKRPLSNSPSRLPMEEDASLGDLCRESETVDGTFCNEEKEKRISQGKDPRTSDENSQGGDLSTPEENSQGKDPRTLREPVERWRAQKKRKEKKCKKKGKRKRRKR